MPQDTNETTRNDDLNAETLNFNDSCSDMTLVTDGHFIDEDIVELTDKHEYIDEP